MFIASKWMKRRIPQGEHPTPVLISWRCRSARQVDDCARENPFPQWERTQPALEPADEKRGPQKSVRGRADRWKFPESLGTISRPKALRLRIWKRQLPLILCRPLPLDGLA